jgi:3-deoxy-D-manno-octulosonate 8-phosphate phosphatase (KDO 8-P phosphatase)
LPSDLTEALRCVRLAAFDVDGVLTDGRFLLTSDGRDGVRFHTRDGLGVRLLLEAGVRVAWITGRRSTAVSARGLALGVPHVHLGVEDKAEILREVMAVEAVQPEEVLYMGDDLPDLPAMAVAGVPVAVADAASEVRERARLVTTHRGGDGAVRELAQRILAAKGCWSEIVSRFSGDLSG